MKYLGAYLLAVLGGNASPKVEDIKNILGSVGVDADAEAAKLVVSSLEGKSIKELIAEGTSKIATVSIAAPAASSTPAAAAAPAADKPAKKEEPKEESDDDMGFGLFD